MGGVVVPVWTAYPTGVVGRLPGKVLAKSTTWVVLIPPDPSDKLSRTSIFAAEKLKMSEAAPTKATELAVVSRAIYRFESPTLASGVRIASARVPPWMLNPVALGVAVALTYGPFAPK